MRAFNPEKELYKIQHGNKNKIIFGVIALLLILTIGSTYALYQVRYSKRIIYTKVAPFSNRDLILSVYVDGKKQSNVPSKDKGYIFEYIKCDSNNSNDFAIWDNETWKLISSLSLPNKCDIYFTKGTQESIIKDFTYTGGVQEYNVPQNGTYQIELWGASGGDRYYLGGKGAYTSGLINLTKDEKLYFYVGGSGNNGGYNGGTAVVGGTWAGDVYGAGGGATDVRLTSGVWSDFNSLKSRIMVAAGGGGANNRGDSWGGGPGGAGGAIIGLDGIHSTSHTSYSYGSGGTQTKGGDRVDVNNRADGYSGSFGAGGAGQTSGGDGYYGGGAGTGGGGGGGSSFISGHSGCNAIKDAESTDINNIVHSEQPNHYSGKVFSNSTMISGDHIMPTYNGLLVYGNTGNGYARITLISES